MKYKPAIKRWILDLVCSPTVAVISCAHTSEYILMLSMPTQLIRYPFLLLLPMEQTTSIEWWTAKILRRAHSAPSHRVINRAEKERERDKDTGACAESQPLLYIISLLFHTLLLIPSFFCSFLIYMRLLSGFFQTVPLFRQLTCTNGDASHFPDHLSQIYASHSFDIGAIIHHHSSSYCWIHTGFFCRLAKVCKLT